MVKKHRFSPQLPEVLAKELGMDSNDARYMAYDSIGQKCAESDNMKNTTEYLMGAPQVIHLPVSVKVSTLSVQHYPYDNGIRYYDSKGGKHKQMNTIHAVTKVVDQEWQDVTTATKGGEAVTLNLEL